MKISKTFQKFVIFILYEISILYRQRRTKCKPKAFADGVQGVVVHPRVVSL